MDDRNFEEQALEIFRFQYRNNPLYQQYVRALQKVGEEAKSIGQIPFLPIRFFKEQVVRTTEFEPEAIFESSGTTQSVPSRHYIKDLAMYAHTTSLNWEKFYGDPGNWCFIGLLPSYLERMNSSLVYMVNGLIGESKHP